MPAALGFILIAQLCISFSCPSEKPWLDQVGSDWVTYYCLSLNHTPSPGINPIQTTVMQSEEGWCQGTIYT